MATAPFKRAVVTINSGSNYFSVLVNDLEETLKLSPEELHESNLEVNQHALALKRALFIQQTLDDAIAKDRSEGKLCAKRNRVEEVNHGERNPERS